MATASKGVLKLGGKSARMLSHRFLGVYANDAALKAIAYADRPDNSIAMTETGGLWRFDKDSAAAAGPSVLVPTAGDGRWVATAGGGSGATVKSVTWATTTALAGNARASNTLTANADGALGVLDGVTTAVGQRVLVQDEGTGANNGIYVIDSVGSGSTKWSMTRASDADTSDEVASGMLVHAQQGTANGDEWFTLTTNDDITVNTTALTFVQVPSLADLASILTGEGASLLGVYDAAGNLVATEVESALAELAEGGGTHQVPMRTVRGASTADVPNLAAFVVPHDGVTYVAGERILLKDQATAAQDGIYVVGAVAGTAPLTRSNDWNANIDVKPGLLVAVSEGTANQNTIWKVTAPAPFVVGTDDPAMAEVWTAARGLATTGAAAGAITDADGALTATTLDGSVSELAEGGGIRQIPTRTVRGQTLVNLAAFTGVANPIDGVTYVDGERILVNNQTTGEEDGIYVWSGVGVTDDLTRDADWDSAVNCKTGTMIYVSEGTLGARKLWQVTAPAPFVVGTDDPLLVHVAGFTAQNDTIYVGKHGLDTNNGVRVETALLTFTAAIAAATALTPGAANHISIVCLDSGIYTEDITVPSYVHMNAPEATLTGILTLATLSSVVLGTLTGPTGPELVVAAGTARARIRELVVAGAVQGTNITNAVVDLVVDRATVENADLFVVNNATGILNLRCNQINITGTGSALVATDGAIMAVLGDVTCAGAGVAFETAAAATALIHATAAFVDCNTRWVLGAASELHLTAAFMDAGVETGTATRLSIAGEVYESGGPTNLVIGAVDDTQYMRRTGATVVGGYVQEAPGVPMINRLQMLGAPARIVEGDYFTIGADVYEFRDDTPPSGGTVGRIWVRTVTDSATCRANAIDAINGVVDAARITYNVAVTETMFAEAGVSLGDIIVSSADAIGGNPVASAVATVCTDNLTTVTDIWDQGTMLSGVAAGIQQQAVAVIVITAAMIAKGDVQVMFDFTPTRVILENRDRAQDEAYAIVGDSISLTLGGGAPPNNQIADTIDVWAWS